MKGELVLGVPGADPGEAEIWFRQGYDQAAELGARLPQLRAAAGLCRAQRARGGGEQATELLRATYAEFSEGFATPDLTEAAALLETPAA